jgi:hypothetical protein
MAVEKKDFAAFTADDILDAWLEALNEGLGPGRTFEDGITDRNGVTAKALRRTIEAELERRTHRTDGSKGFDALAFRASTRVARDLGRICAIMADATKDKIVTNDVFQKARDLTKLHASCPEEAIIGGGGPFC